MAVKQHSRCTMTGIFYTHGFFFFEAILHPLVIDSCKAMGNHLALQDQGISLSLGSEIPEKGGLFAYPLPFSSNPMGATRVC